MSDPDPDRLWSYEKNDYDDQPDRPYPHTGPIVHPCGIVGDHVGECLDCGIVAELGWAHRCLACWERPAALPDEVESVRGRVEIDKIREQLKGEN